MGSFPTSSHLLKLLCDKSDHFLVVYLLFFANGFKRQHCTHSLICIHMIHRVQVGKNHCHSLRAFYVRGWKVLGADRSRGWEVQELKSPGAERSRVEMSRGWNVRGWYVRGGKVRGGNVRMPFSPYLKKPVKYLGMSSWKIWTLAVSAEVQCWTQNSSIRRL